MIHGMVKILVLKVDQLFLMMLFHLSTYTKKSTLQPVIQRTRSKQQTDYGFYCLLNSGKNDSSTQDYSYCSKAFLPCDFI